MWLVNIFTSIKSPSVGLSQHQLPPSTIGGNRCCLDYTESHCPHSPDVEDHPDFISASRSTSSHTAAVQHYTRYPAAHPLQLLFKIRKTCYKTKGKKGVRLSHPGCPSQPPHWRHAGWGDGWGHRRLSSRGDGWRWVASWWQAQAWRRVRRDGMGRGQAWGWEVGVVGGGRWRVARSGRRDGGWGERGWGRGHWRWGGVRGVDVGVVGQVSWWPVGRGQGAVRGTLRLHHGLQALVALSRHVGAGGGHPGYVAGGRWRRRPVWQRRGLVHGGGVGRRRNLDFGEVTGIHRARRLGLAQGR